MLVSAFDEERGMKRSISWSEITRVMTCEASWDFGYGGHLMGGKTLKRKAISPHLSNGRSWGAAVAAWHASLPQPSPGQLSVYDILAQASAPTLAKFAAYGALRASYEADVAEQAGRGIYVPVLQRVQQANWLSEVLEHYMLLAEPMPLTKLEHELDVPLPSRTGVRASSRYHFQGFLDGFVQNRGYEVVEFKLRDTLTPVPLIQNDRQIRHYAWAYQKISGVAVMGAIVEERLAAAPKPPKIVFAKRKGEGTQGEDGRWRVPSHDVQQMTTSTLYRATCAEYGVEPVSPGCDRGVGPAYLAAASADHLQTG